MFNKKFPVPFCLAQIPYGMDSRLLRREIGDYPCESWHGPVYGIKMD